MLHGLLHAGILVLTVIAGFLFPRTNLAAYEVHIIAAMFVLLYVIKKLPLPSTLPYRLFESMLFTFLIIVVIVNSGSLQSPFFFLLYFLMFAVSLLLAPMISAALIATTIILFLLNTPPNQPAMALVPLFSLAFITPFALFMGKEFEETRRLHHETSRLRTKLTKNKETTFLFLSLVLRNHLRSILHHVDNFLGDHDLNSIRRHVHEMNKLIDRYEHET